MNIIDRVTMKESIRSRVMIIPFTHPAKTPTPRARATASPAGRPQVSSPRPRTTVAMLPIAPTARLIWPTTRQKACDRATRT